MANGFGQSILNAFKDPLHDQLTSLGVPFGTIGLTAKAFRNYGNELVAAGEPFPEVTAENLRRMEKFHERSGQQPPNYQQWGGEWTGDQWVTTQQQRERAAAEAAQAAVDLRRQQLTDPYNLQGIGEQAIQEWMPAFNRMNQPADPVDATPVVATPVVATPERVTTIDTSTLPQPRLTEIDTSGFPQKRGATGEPSQSWQERLFGFGGGDPGMNMMMTGLRMLGNASQGQGFGQSLADAYTAQTGDARQLEAQSYARNQATLDRELAESELALNRERLDADVADAERRAKQTDIQLGRAANTLESFIKMYPGTDGTGRILSDEERRRRAYEDYMRIQSNLPSYLPGIPGVGGSYDQDKRDIVDAVNRSNF